MDGYQHYIRLNQAGDVILGFSSTFPEIATVQEGDICIDKDAPRHFTLQLIDDKGRFRYKWDATQSQLVERTEADMFNLNAYKQNKIREFMAAKNQELLAGFSSNATGTILYFGYDTKDQEYLHKKATMVTIDPTITSIDWKTRDGFVNLTKDQFIQVVKAGDAHEESLVYKLLYAEANVMNCTTKESVDAIVW